MPVGFMAHVDHGQFKLVLCSAGFAQVTNTALIDTAQDTNQHDHDAATHHADTCPFAHSGGVALPVLAALTIPGFQRAREFTASFRQPRLAVLPSPSHRVRGPPIFS